jgi:hypothetical protein
VYFWLTIIELRVARVEHRHYIVIEGVGVWVARVGAA